MGKGSTEGLQQERAKETVVTAANQDIGQETALNQGSSNLHVIIVLKKVIRQPSVVHPKEEEKERIQ